MKVTWFALVVALFAPVYAAADPAQPGATRPGKEGARAVQRLQLEAMETAPIEVALPELAPVKGSDLEPNQIGVSRKLELDELQRVDESGLRWEASAGGVVARIRTQSPGAAATRVGLRFEAMPDDLEIIVAQVLPDGMLAVVNVATARAIARLENNIWPMEHWTATTDGPAQVIELRTARKPDDRELRFRLFDISHLLQKLTDPIRPKALDFNCHVDVSCIANPDVQTDSKAVARMLYTRDGRSFVCTGSLLSDRVASFTPLFATANHCISTQASASSLETSWFFYPPTCGAPAAAPIRVTGGATLLLADFDTDFTLLRLAANPPAGAHFLGWDPAPLAARQSIFGLHHPDGAFQRYSSGTFDALSRIRDQETGMQFGNQFNRVAYTQGIIEGGSSGSPLLTVPGSFRGTLFGSPNSNTCAAPVRLAFYSDFSAIYPMIVKFLAGPNATDDHADVPSAATVIPAAARFVGEINSASDEDWFRVVLPTRGAWTVSSFDATPGVRVDVRAEVYGADGTSFLAANDDRALGDANFSVTHNIAGPTTLHLRVVGGAGVVGRYGVRATFAPPDDYGDSPATATLLPPEGTFSGQLGTETDQDWFRVTFNESGTFHVISLGTTDTLGRLYRADGTTLVAENDDENSPDTNFGLTASVAAGSTYYVQVTGWEGSTGPYGLVTSLTPGAAVAPANYTDLWGYPLEAGWGITLNHQGDKIFAALFTYAADGRDMWLFASGLERQPDGSFAGPLFRSTGAAFNAAWRQIDFTQVGTMRIAFSASGQGTLTYSVNGVSVSKLISRQAFGAAVTCTPTSGSRVAATNFQDLWWNPQEAGWGVNLAHQGSTIFAALFTYAADGRDMWLFASGLQRQPNGSFTGPLFRATGPPFNAAPWSPISLSTVGAMTLSFANGTTGTIAYSVDGVSVTKQIQRQVFGSQAPLCQ